MTRETDTFLGGPQRNFPTTIWSDVLAARDPAQLNLLVRSYWKPVFAYIRTAWRKPVEDSKDLTQAFFTHLLSKEFVARLSPERGSFRGFLKRSVKNFLIDAERLKATAAAGAETFSIDAAPGELDRFGPAAPDEDPDRTYDRAWFKILMDASVEELRRRLGAEGKSTYFEVFRTYCLGPVEKEHSTVLEGQHPSAPTYKVVAEKLGIKESDVRNYLTYCRNLLREILRERIRDYVADDGDVDHELKQVLLG